MKQRLIYRGLKHPRFAVLESENLLLELHGGYRGSSHRIDPVAVHFEVHDIKKTSGRIGRYGGKLKHSVRNVEWFPQKLQVLETAFVDPDGNEFEVFQRVKN